MKQLDQCALTPVVVDIFELRVDFVWCETPWKIW